MTITQESSTPPTIGTDLQVSLLVGPATEIRVTDAHHPDKDIVALYFDDVGGRANILGDLAMMQRWVDEAAHQLMLISTARGHAEEAGERARGLAGVADLRQAAADARAEAVG